jgi:hypothetical protein
VEITAVTEQPTREESNGAGEPAIVELPEPLSGPSAEPSSFLADISL